jgi:integrase
MAQQLAQKVYDDILKEAYGLSGNVTLDEAIDRWLKYAEINKGPKSFHDDRAKWEIIIKFFGAGTLLKDIKPSGIEEFKGYLKRNRGISGTTVNRYLALLKSAINLLVKDGDYDGRNPVSYVKYFQESQRNEYYKMDQIQEILNYARGVSENATSPSQFYFHPFLMVAYYTGMRAGEIFNLRWDDLKNDRLIIRKSKTGQAREIPLSGGLYKLLMDLPRESVFVINTGQRRSDAFRLQWLRLKKALKINGVIIPCVTVSPPTSFTVAPMSRLFPLFLAMPTYPPQLYIPTPILSRCRRPLKDWFQ